MATNAVPTITLPFLYVNDLQVSYTSSTTLTVNSGQCRDSTNIYDLVLDTPIVLSTTIQGVGGLDTGTIAASTWYAVYVISDSLQYQPTTCLFSLSGSIPTLPANYDIFRLVGWQRTNGSSNFNIINTIGNANERQSFWDTEVSVLSGGASTTFASVSLATAVPAIDNTSVIFDVSFTPATGGDSVFIRPTGSSATVVAQLSSVVAAKSQIAQLTVLSKLATGVPSVDYKNSAASGSTTLLVNSFKYFI